MVIVACFVHSRGCLWRNSSVNIRELTSSSGEILRTVRTNAWVNHGSFMLRAVIPWSHSSLRIPPIHYTVDWWPFTFLSIYSHPTACCFRFYLLPVLRTIFKYASWVIPFLAALAESRWNTWCLCSCCGPMSEVFDSAHGNRVESYPLSPGRGGCVSTICWCGIGEEDHNGHNWEVLRTI